MQNHLFKDFKNIVIAFAQIQDFYTVLKIKPDILAINK